MYAFAPTGSPIVGTLEGLAACAEIREDSFHKTSCGVVEFDHEGATEVFWDTETTEENEGGEPLFLDEDGREWAGSEIVLSDSPS